MESLAAKGKMPHAEIAEERSLRVEIPNLTCRDEKVNFCPSSPKNRDAGVLARKFRKIF
jgi:hypothetical protein